MMRDRKLPSAQELDDLWIHGKFWEILGFSSNDFTSLELAKQYSVLSKSYLGRAEDIKIVAKVFAILNAPQTRQSYENCRMIMQDIREGMDSLYFLRVEGNIWSDLWGWVSASWQEPTEEIINTIKTKYEHHDDPDNNTFTQGYTWSDEKLIPADLDDVREAKIFTQEIKCQRCGKFDHTLRVVAFPYVISILIASFKRADSGIFCHNCRCIKSIQWALVSLIFGWWSIWGFFWNIGALIDNFRGGKMPDENNEPLIKKLVWANLTLGKIAATKAALKELTKYNSTTDSVNMQRELNTKYPSISPLNYERFRLGYLTVVFAVVSIWVTIGVAIFGGGSTSSTAPTYTTPTYTYPPQTASTSNTQKSTLLAQINSNKARLTDLENQIDSIDIELDRYDSQLDAIDARYPSGHVPEPYFSEYNNIVDKYNTRLAVRKNLYNDYESLLQTTNNLVDKYNSMR